MSETKTCPFCGEEILSSAKKCTHCGEWINNVNQEYCIKNIDKYGLIITIAIVIFIPMPLGIACLIAILGGIICRILKERQKNKFN